MKFVIFSQVAILALLLTMFFTGCTISFQNISTHGTATDLVDENQTPTANVTVPVSLTKGL